MTTAIRHGVRVEEAALADVPAIVRQALDFNRATPYRAHIMFDPARLATVAQQLIESPNGLMLVARHEDAVVGMLAAALAVHPLSGELQATEIVWWMAPGDRGGRAAIRLLKSYERWARDHGATVLQMVSPDHRTAEFYTRLGFAEVERLHQRRLR